MGTIILVAVIVVCFGMAAGSIALCRGTTKGAVEVKLDTTEQILITLNS